VTIQARARDRGRDDVLVIIPAFNEEANVAFVIDEVHDEGFAALVVDDGSTDRTGEVAELAGAVVLRLPVNLGVGGALRCAFRFAVTHGYATVVQCDADGQHDPRDIHRLLETMHDSEAELVIGSRFTAGRPREVGLGRRLAMGQLARTASRETGAHITDATSGFRAIGGSLLGSFAAHYPSEYLGDTVEALARAGQGGHKVAEVDVHMRPRLSGISTASSMSSMWYVVRVMAALRVQSYRPNGRRAVEHTQWERWTA
jgi:glycosyltransferase involved in cell wall biosynthesis